MRQTEKFAKGHMFLSMASGITRGRQSILLSQLHMALEAKRGGCFIRVFRHLKMGMPLSMYA